MPHQPLREVPCWSERDRRQDCRIPAPHILSWGLRRRVAGSASQAMRCHPPCARWSRTPCRRACLWRQWLPPRQRPVRAAPQAECDRRQVPASPRRRESARTRWALPLTPPALAAPGWPRPRSNLPVSPASQEAHVHTSNITTPACKTQLFVEKLQAATAHEILSRTCAGTSSVNPWWDGSHSDNSQG